MSYLGIRGERSQEPQLRLIIAVVAMGVVFGVVLLRLWQLQLLNGAEYREGAENLATDLVPIPAPRGNIYDRNGVILAEVLPVFDLLVTPTPGVDRDKLLARLGELVSMSDEELRAQWDKAVKYSRYKPSIFKRGLTQEEVAKVEVFRPELPGVEVKLGPRRSYNYGPLFAHSIGYLGEVTEAELKQMESDPEKRKRYKQGHYIGKWGVEAGRESELKGDDGLRLVTKNRLGETVAPDRASRFLKDFAFLGQAERRPVPGKNVYLTIDLGLQQAIAEAFGEQSGAVVAMDVNSGAIRAMFQAPSFDPEGFARGWSVEEWAALRDNPDRPLNDKALRGVYPPGSTYKIVTAAAALELGKVSPTEHVNCRGSIPFGNRTFRCWKRAGHGPVDLHTAIQRSCDVYFYTMGMRVGVDPLAKISNGFGFGKPTGIPINDELGGLIPTREWKRIARRQEWQDGETLSIAIGQGYDLVTPIQLAVAYAAIANGGFRYQPHLVERIVDPNGEVELEPPPRLMGTLPISEEHRKMIHEGLKAVVNEPGGTAYWSVRIPELPIAGKTGTAQVIRSDEKFSQATLNRFKDHALFVAYAPADKPELVISVVVEHGGHGGSAAGPVAKAAFEYYFADAIAAEKERLAEERKSGKHKTSTHTPTPAVAAPTPSEATPVPSAVEGTAPAITPSVATPVPTTAVAETPVPTPPDEVAAPTPTPTPTATPGPTDAAEEPSEAVP